MTRINAGIRPECLIDQHLIAELRELPRIFTLVKKRLENNTIGIVNIPDKFTLGTGHVTFFYNKLKYLETRHIILKDEYYNRFNKYWQYSTPSIDSLSKTALVDLETPWIATINAKKLLVERISYRISTMKNEPRYMSTYIPRNVAIEALKTRNINNILTEVEKDHFYS